MSRSSQTRLTALTLGLTTLAVSIGLTAVPSAAQTQATASATQVQVTGKSSWAANGKKLPKSSTTSKDAVAKPMVPVSELNGYRAVSNEDMRSPEKVAAIIAQRKAFAAAQQKKREEEYAKAVKLAKKENRPLPPKPAKVKSATGYLEAYQYWLAQRAYPNNDVNLDNYHKATESRKTLKPFVPEGKANATLRTNSAKSAAVANPPVPGAQWEFIGPRNLTTPYQIYYGPLNSATSGRVDGIVFDPRNANIAYMTAGGGGVWKTTDGGRNWVVKDKDFPTQNCGPIAIDPKNSQILYVGLGDFHGRRGTTGGILKSTDGGENWTRLDPTNNAFVRSAISALEVDPEDSNRIIAASGRLGPGNIWVSTDGGRTWATRGSANDWSDLEISKSSVVERGRVVRNYFAVADVDPALYRSSDRGETWQRFALPDPPSGQFYAFLEVAPSPSDRNVVYVIASLRSATTFAVEDGRVLRGQWTGNGYSWGADADRTAFMTNFPHGDDSYNWSQDFYDIHMTAVSQLAGGRSQDVLYTGLITFAGKPVTSSWSDIGVTFTGGALTHNDQHSFAAFPGDRNRMLVGNDGGIYGLTYNPSTGRYTFNDRLSATLGITMFYYGDFHPTNPNIAIGGTQDNATPVSRGDLNNWANRGGGDGGGVAINPLNPNIQYTTAQFGVFYKTANTWATSAAEIIPISDGAFIGRLVIDAKRPNAVYYGGERFLHRYVEPLLGGSGWETNLGGVDFGSQVLAIAVAPSDSRTIFVGTQGGGGVQSVLAVTEDGGENWFEIAKTGLPNRAFTDIWVNPTNPTDIIVTLSGFGSAHVWRTRNAGETWQNISGTGADALPDVPTNTIAQDPFDTTGNTFYVGTDIGVFVTTDGGQTWQDATRPLGLPNAQISTLKAMPKTGYLMAATYGRGMYRLPILAAEETVYNFRLNGVPGPFRRGQRISIAVNLTSATGQPTSQRSAIVEIRRQGATSGTRLPVTLDARGNGLVTYTIPATTTAGAYTATGTLAGTIPPRTTVNTNTVTFRVQ